MLHESAEIIYLTGLVLGSVVRSIGVKRSGVQRHRDMFSVTESLILLLTFLGMFVLPLIYLFSPWLDFANYTVSGWLQPLLTTLGSILFLLAIWLLWRTHGDLASNFSPAVELHKNHKLITTGVFQRMRHPMYSAHLLWGIAQALLLPNWIAGLSMILTQIPLLVYRIPREERMLAKKFGVAYWNYTTRTWRFFPKI